MSEIYEVIEWSNKLLKAPSTVTFKTRADAEKAKNDILNDKDITIVVDGVSHLIRYLSIKKGVYNGSIVFEAAEGGN